MYKPFQLLRDDPRVTLQRYDTRKKKQENITAKFALTFRSNFLNEIDLSKEFLDKHFFLLDELLP